MEQIPKTQAPAQEEGVVSETTLQSSEASDALQLQQLQPNEPHALHRAAEIGDVNTVKLLIQLGCAVDERDAQYRTPMLVAAQEGHVDVVTELIRNGATVDAADRNEMSALWYAARDGHLQVVVELIRNGATVESMDAENLVWITPLPYAAENGHLDIVAELIRNGALVNASDQDGRAPLSYAAASGQFEVVAELIRSGATVDASCDNMTALSYAAEGGHLNIVSELILRGATVNDKHHNGCVALSAAARRGHFEVVVELLHHGAAIDCVPNGWKSALSCAAEGGHCETVMELLRHGAAVDVKDEYGRTALSHAAEGGHFQVVVELIRNGAAVEVKDDSERPALPYAAEGGHLDIVAELVRNGADVNTEDKGYRSPLSYAAASGHFEVVAELIRSGAAVDGNGNNQKYQLFWHRGTALSYAAEGGHLKIVSELIRHGAMVNGKLVRTMTALSLAAQRGHFEVVMELIRSGATIDDKDDNKRAALLYAAGGGHCEIVKELLRRDAAVDKKDRDGRTALLYAAKDGHLQVLVELIRHGAAVEVKDDDGRTAVSYAAEGGHFDVVVELIQNGATIDTKDSDEKTPLLHAASDCRIVVALIKAGAAVDNKDRCDRTALSYAAERGLSEVVTSLLQLGAAVNSKDMYGRTALSYAAESDHVQVVSTLLQHSAAVDVKDNGGRTALSYAVEKDRVDTVAMLIRNNASVNTRDEYHRHPLWYAAMYDFSSVVAQVIQKSVAEDSSVCNLTCGLSYAAEGGHLKIVSELIRHGAMVNGKLVRTMTALSLAAQRGHFEVVMELIRSGATIDDKDDNKRAALSYAAGGGHCEIVKELLRRDAAIDVSDQCMRTSILYAAKSGHYETVMELPRHSAAVDIKDGNGRTALSHAAQGGHFQVVVELIRNGAAVEVKDDNGRSALSYAAENGNLEVITELVHHAADVNAKDNNGRTALSYALDYGWDSAVVKLIELGSAVDVEDNAGRTPLSYAAERGHSETFVELVRLRADINAKDKMRRTALSYAAEKGHLNIVEMLLHHHATVDVVDKSGRTALIYAADVQTENIGHRNLIVRTMCSDQGIAAKQRHIGAAEQVRIDIVTRLVESDAAVNGKDVNGRTALSFAAGRGNTGITEKLIDLGAAVDAKDNDGRSALSYAAEQGHFEVVIVLLQRGAAVDCPHSNGRTALSYAAERENAEFVAKLIQHGAAVDVKDKEGRTAISYAVLKGKEAVVEQLFRSSVVDKSNNSVTLFVAAAMGKLASVEELVAAGEYVDCRTKDGRTPLFYAAEFGHAGVIKYLIENGALVAAKACVNSHSPRESETSLALAGRAGHMKAFRALIEAGAPVNVRSGEGGETPLISAARLDFFAGVQLLISHGGCLREDEVKEDEYPLLPGTLKTMQTLCGTAFEFEWMCSRILIRLEEICSKLQEAHVMRAKKDTLVSFASILFRFCRLLFDIEKRQRPLSRFIGSRAITNRVQDFHEDLDHFVAMLPLEHSEGNWKDQVIQEQSLLEERFEEQLSSDETLVDGLDFDETKANTAVLLLYELKVCCRDGQRAKLQASLERVVERFLRVCDIQAPNVPEWFISHDDVEFHSWNLVRSNMYEGKWNKTAVMIETSYSSLSEFAKSASTWHQLNHPNVIKLFGAFHIGSVKSFVFEVVEKGRQLQEFVSMESNRSTILKCLYGAALGLQYLHNQKIVHKNLRSENIIVGTDLHTKLHGAGGSSRKYYAGKRRSFHWMAPEIARRQMYLTPLSLASDIYAFAMCIWEALSLELPWKDANEAKAIERLRNGKLPGRPERLSDGEWALIKKMCATDPSERVSISYVLNRLKQFVSESEQIDGGAAQKSSAPTEAESKTIEEHVFADLHGGTIPNALQHIRSRCGELEGRHWMSNNMYPALEHIFALLRKHQKTPMDTEALEFYASLSRFQRYLRTVVSKKSVYELARSRRVAEVHHVVYAELDRLLDTLDVPEADPIRVWRHSLCKLSESEQVGGGLVSGAAPKSYVEKPNAKSSAVTINRFGTLSAIHDLWTQAGLAKSPTAPTWFLPLRDLVFSKSDGIGRGSFGTVYKGTWLNTAVVIKFMGYEEDFNTISTELLLHEVRVWHRLNHPHVLKMYGACHVDKRYFVCEYASNGELNKYLKKSGNEHLVWKKLYEAALGLEYLHGQNITHNDLKCDNIMIGVDNKAKLIDFGLSCVLGEAEIQIDVKQIGAVNWRSPEYLTGERPSFASDVYSFAMCIIEVVSGDIPWGKMAPAAVRFQVLKRNNIPNLPESMSEKERNLIKLMTKSEPSERVRMPYVVDKLNEITQDEKAMRAP